MNQATKETTPFIHFKAMVADAAGLAIADLHADRLAAAYDIGEPVWMVADEMKLRAEAAIADMYQSIDTSKPVKPYRLPRLDSAVCVRWVRN